MAGLAALVALQFFGGHPETSFHVMFVTAVWFAFRALLAWSAAAATREALVRPTVAFAGALVLGTALAALMLVPLLEFFLNSGDCDRRLDDARRRSRRGSTSARFFLTDYWGRPTQTALAAFVSNRGYYAGGITLMLAAVALVLRPTLTRVGAGGVRGAHLQHRARAGADRRCLSPRCPGFRPPTTGAWSSSSCWRWRCWPAGASTS